MNTQFINRATDSKVRTTIPDFSSFRMSEPVGPITVDGFEFQYQFIHFPAIRSATGGQLKNFAMTADFLAAQYVHVIS